MFFRLIRDWKIARNHKRRVNSIVLKSNEKIVRTMDDFRMKYLEAERREDKDNTIKYKAMVSVFDWLINESE